MIKKVLNGVFLALLFTAGAQTDNPDPKLPDSEFAMIYDAKSQNKLDHLAAREFREYFRKATGTGLMKDASLAKHRIYIGRTAATEKAVGKKRLDSLREDESLVMSVNGDLFLTGGGRFGTVYAVYCFLEEQLGVRWYDITGGEKVPKCGPLNLKPLNYTRRPQYRCRMLITSEYHHHPNAAKFLFRNRINMIWGNFRSDPELDVLYKVDTPMCHTIHYYITPTKNYNPYNWKWDEPKDYFKTNPEFFSLDQKGKRTTGLQLCFSNPSLRKEFTRRVKERIRRTGNQLFAIAASDWPGKYCYCPDCQAREKKYGCIAGPLLDYLIELCRDLEKSHPGVIISHSAYRKTQSEFPPNPAVKFPANFRVSISLIDDDLTKDLSHKNNRGSLENIRKWAQQAAWVDFDTYPGWGGASPGADFERMCSNSVIALQAGATGSAHEHDVNVFTGLEFSDMLTWVLVKSFQTPSRDWKSLVREFADFYYGKAADKMTEIIFEMQKIRTGSKHFVPWDGRLNLNYTPAMLARWYKEFDLMEQLTAEDKLSLSHVRDARALVDLKILERWQDMKEFNLPCNPKELHDRFLAYLEDSCKRRYPTRKQAFLYFSRGLKTAVNRAYMLANITPKPLPSEFASIPREKIVQTFPITTSYAKSVPYQEGAFGYAMRDPKIRLEMPFTFGFYDQQNKKNLARCKLEKKDIVIDKFHFYKVGTVTISQKCRLYLMRSWFAHIQLEQFHKLGFPDKKWDLYVSLKFEGPGYGKSKSKENNVWMDRVVLVEK